MEEICRRESKQRRLPILLVFGVVLFFILSYFLGQNKARAANAPSIITYQGKLLVSSKLATTTQSMYFVLYDALTGGNILYTASGTIATPQAVSTTPVQGLFSINLGATSTTNALTSAIFQNNQSVYLEVRIGADTLTPRKQITAAPYAINSRYLDGVGVNTNSTTQYIPMSDTSGNFNFNSTTITTLTVSTTLKLPSVATSTFPASGTAGRLMRASNDVRGLWLDMGSQWFALNARQVNVQEFGAKGDGVTDDGAAFRAAIAAAGASGTVIVPNPSSFYLITLTSSSGSSLVITEDVHIKGVSRNVKIKVNTLESTSTALLYNLFIANSPAILTIENLTLEGPDPGGGAFSAIHHNTGVGGLVVRYVSSSKFAQFLKTDVGSYLGGIFVDVQDSDITTKLDDNLYNSFLINELATFRMRRTKVANETLVTVQASSSYIAYINRGVNVDIDDSDFGNAPGYGVQVWGGSTTTTPDYVSISNSRFIGRYGISGVWSSFAVLTNNRQETVLSNDTFVTTDGAILALGDVRVNNSKFSSGSATQVAGGIQSNAVNSTFSIDHSNFYNTPVNAQNSTSTWRISNSRFNSPSTTFNVIMYVTGGHMSLVNNIFEGASSQQVLHYSGELETRNNRFLNASSSAAIEVAVGYGSSPILTSIDNYFASSTKAFIFDSVIPTSSSNLRPRHATKTGTTAAASSLVLDWNFDTYRITGSDTINTINLQNASYSNNHINGLVTLIPEPGSTWSLGSSGNIIADIGARKPNQGITLQFLPDRVLWFEYGGRVAGSGTAGQVSFWSATGTLSGTSSLFWDSTNARLGIGTSTPTQKLSVVGNISNLIDSNSSISQIASTSVGIGPISVFISGRYAYVANYSSSSISVVDISNPSAPTQIATTSVGTNPYSIYVSGRYAYVTNYNSNSISIVDISNPFAPTQIATISVGVKPRGIFVSGRYAYVANEDSNTISVVDISNPSAPTQIATTSVGTNPYSIYISGRYAYVANYSSSSISVVDISNPSAPTQIATTSVGTNPASIYVSGRYAYVANYSSNTISVVDISNPSAPTQIATTSVGTNPGSIYVSGRYAYVANFGSNNISVIDISNPSAPAQITTTSVGTNPGSIYVSGRYAYTANFSTNNISVVDISGTEVSSLMAHSAEVGNIQSRNDIFAQGNIMAGTGLMVGAGGIMSQGSLSVFASSTGATSSIFGIDSAQTSNIFKALANGRIGIGTSTPQSKLTIQGTGNENPFSIVSSTAAASTMFTVLTNGNVGIGTSTPTQKLSVVGNISNITDSNSGISQIATTSVGDGPWSVFVSGRYAYVANYNTSTISVVDVSNPLAPAQISTTSVGLFPISIAVSGRYAYVANQGSANISVVDISNPKNPTSISTVGVGSNPSSVYISGRYIYVANLLSNAISVVDISNPKNPILIATTTVDTRPASVYISGRYAYVTHDNTAGSISVIDISNPSLPALVATTSVGVGPTYPNSVAVSGRYAYVANYGSSTLSVVDISNPSAPAQIATTSVGNGPYSIHVSGRYAYVTNYNSNFISIVDISNPSAPTQIVTTSVGLYPTGIYVSGRYAYVASFDSDSISVVDISGTEVSSLMAHSAEVGNIQSRNDIFAQGNIIAGTSLVVGAGGIMSQGSLSVFASSTGATSSIFSIDSAQTSNIFKIFANGRVGIGTSTPAAKLTIQGTGNENPFSILTSTAAASSMFTVLTNGNVGINSSSPIASLALQGTGGTNPFSINSSTGASLLTVLTNGYVGINTTTPSARLTIQGASTENPFSIVSSTAAASTMLTVLTNGNVGIGISNPAQALAVNGHVRIETGSYLYSGALLMLAGSIGADDDTHIYSAGTERARAISTGFNITGRLGVNSTTPLANLAISGQAGVTPLLVVSSTGGSMFTVLQSGNVGINSSTPMSTFSVQGTVSMLGLGVNITGNGVCVTATGTITDAGAAACVPSALQFKTNITPYTDSAVALFTKLVENGAIKNYERKDKPGPRKGLIADYVANVDEDLVVYNNGQIWSLNFEDFTGLAVVAIAELDEEINKRQEVLTIDATSSIIMVGSSTNPYNLTVTGNISLSNASVINKLSFATSTLFESNAAGGRAFIFNALNFSITSTDNYLLSLRSNNTPVFSVSTGGDVHAKGNYYGASAVLGTSTNPGDLAERVDVAIDDTVEPGDVMVVDKNAPDTYRRSGSAYEQSVAGIISSNPTIIVGNGKTDYTAVMAMVGRVPVKVSNENGNIQRGDLLITASTTGLAMKYDPAKDNNNKMVAVIGVALESFAPTPHTPSRAEGDNDISLLPRGSAEGVAEGKVLALIRTGWIYNRDQAINNLQNSIEQVAAAQGINLASTSEPANLNITNTNGQLSYTGGNLDLQNNSLINVAGIIGKDNKWRIDEWGSLIQKIATAYGDKETYGLQSSGKQEIIISGTSTLENGSKKVILEDLDQAIIDKTVPLKIQITMSGETKGVYVSERNYDSFVVKENENGQSNAEFDWTVIAKVLSPYLTVDNTTEEPVADIIPESPVEVITTTPDTLSSADDFSLVIVGTTTAVIDTIVSSTIDISSSTLTTP